MNSTGFRRSLLPNTAVFLLLTAAAGRGQQVVPTITYEQTFTGSNPEHYVVAIGGDCRGTYQSNGKPAEGEDNRLEFTVTKANCDKVFELTKKVDYFAHPVDSKNKNLAAMGMKTLSYKDEQQSTHATFNYSKIAQVQELTSLFQAIAMTMEFGRRLEYDHRYQKLALDEDLKLGANPDGSGLVEIGAITPTLQKIVEDSSLLNVVRERAQRLLAGGK